MILIERKLEIMEISWTIGISALAIVIMISLISLCFFCKRKTPKSTNPPHRSLPDIPSIPTNEACDNNSELYATVGDKVQDKSDGKGPETQKHSNLSQHSSISQADDPSSPYAQVRSPHAYDKLKRVEHPYAQVVQPGTKGSIAQVVLENDDDEDENENSIMEDPISHRDSSQNLLNSENIPAASAIAGRISASQELPYMTPPIVQPPAMQQHFSGDSQDSKGYTSISVREPLANIRAQTNQHQQNVERRRRDREMNDSHYATVSDDSDEMYAAIEDGGEYTSGSETYAQIQPQPITVSVSVEINQAASNSAIPSTSNRFSNRFSSTSNHIPTIEETAHDTLRVNIHSRQASSSSCTSSVGNIGIGSPKIEKRMGPLPPTPNQIRPSSSTDHRESNIKDSNNNSNKMKQSPSKDLKDLEEMYAKVMKKNKLSNLPSENSSPIMNRKSKESTPGLDMPDCSNDVSNMFSSPNKNKQLPKIPNDYETIEKKRDRNKDEAGYEIIPADRNNNGIKDKNLGESSKAKMSLFQEPGYESLPDRPDKLPDDPNYETLKNFSDYDPNYEIVIPNANLSSSSSQTLIDDGYSQIAKKTKDLNDGYSSIRDFRTLKNQNQMEEDDEDDIPGYSSIKEKKVDDHGYSTLKDPNESNLSQNSINKYEDGSSLNHHYASIPPLVPALNTHLSADNRKTPISETRTTPSTDSNSSEILIDYDIVRTSTSNSVITPTNAQEKSSTNSNYESLSNSESNTEDPNYESMKYLDVKEDNPYERLHSEKNSPEPKEKEDKKPNPNPEVGDFFQV